MERMRGQSPNVGSRYQGAAAEKHEMVGNMAAQPNFQEKLELMSLTFAQVQPSLNGGLTRSIKPYAC